MQENQKEATIDWQELDLILRRWAIMSQWEKDLQNYEDLKAEVDEKVHLGYN
jgi:hypothetical protein